jgi:predicted transcriptional regulator
MALPPTISPRAVNNLQSAEARSWVGIEPHRPTARTAADRLWIGYSAVMSANVSIEVDKHTADVLKMRAAELGVTVPQLIAELATFDSESREPRADEIAELDRRSAKATEGSRVPHERVVQWLRTWGTPRFRPWPGQ